MIINNIPNIKLNNKKNITKHYRNLISTYYLLRLRMKMQ